jgi:RimJ/RimL family protein N-acetyltransferase
MMPWHSFAVGRPLAFTPGPGLRRSRVSSSGHCPAPATATGETPWPPSPDMELRNITLDDLDLYERIHCDPVMMAELGGALPREGLAEKLQRDVAAAKSDEHWVLKIIPDEDAGTAAGTVAIWDHEWHGETITEIGWMVLPPFQGRGLGTEAVRAALRRARTEGRRGVVHAFPATTNGPSNAICRKLGFSMIRELDFEYRGRLLRCNHWRLDLREWPQAEGPRTHR